MSDGAQWREFRASSLSGEDIGYIIRFRTRVDGVPAQIGPVELRQLSHAGESTTVGVVDGELPASYVTQFRLDHTDVVEVKQR